MPFGVVCSETKTVKFDYGNAIEVSEKYDFFVVTNKLLLLLSDRRWSSKKSLQLYIIRYLSAGNVYSSRNTKSKLNFFFSG